MVLKDHDLRQLDEERIRDLKEKDPEALVNLSIRLLEDLKEARERLNQNPSNSSRPPSSQAPWFRAQEDEEDTEVPSDDEHGEDPPEEAPAEPRSDRERGPSAQDCTDNGDSSDTPARRKPGRQPGAPGFGRTQRLTISDWVDHRPSTCALCAGALKLNRAKAYTAFDTVDLVFGDTQDPGLRLTCSRHTYYQTPCRCGHETRETPHRAPEDEGHWQNVVLSEWRLAGPGLCAFIVWLRFRMRVSIRLIRELLKEVFGLALSVGTIQSCVMETGRASEPLEDELTHQLLAATLMHADETPHKEWGQALWLWVFVSTATVLFLIGYRTKEMFENLIRDDFNGELMSDGYQVYRDYCKRLRCWAHLLRKTQALVQCLSPAIQGYGREVDAILNTLMQAVYRAREGPPGSIRSEHEATLEQLKSLCQCMRQSSHDKTKALGTELLNDWEAIFRVLDHPLLPLTNNEAEQMLRHWVILRRITQGTRTEQGSRALALLASVIETCRRRAASPLRYLREVIALRRQGLDVPKLPPIPAAVA
jgi:transposase-like protein